MSVSAPAILRQWDFGTPIHELAVNRDGTRMAFAMGDGSMRFLHAHEEVEQPGRMDAHKGVSLSLEADSDGHAFLSGGDDGQVLIVDPDLTAPTVLAEHKGRWIDHVASSAEGGFRAYSIGREVHLIHEDGQTGAPFTHPSSAGGLAFSPNGRRLAVSHYNGVSLWWTKAKEAVAQKLIWKGSHLGALWNPDGKILMTSLQEGALHGWRLADQNEMRMEGYQSKIHSMGFTAKGRYLVTSGAGEVVCWPFFGGGPWGKAPLTLGGRDARLVAWVAPHPRDELAAAGYDDGMIILAPMDGRMEVMICPPSGGGAVVGLAWNKDGTCLFAALATGKVYLFTLESVGRAVRQGGAGSFG